MPSKVADYADDSSLAVTFLRLGLSLTKSDNHLKIAFMGGVTPMNLLDSAKPSQARSTGRHVRYRDLPPGHPNRGASVSIEMCRFRLPSSWPSQVGVALFE
jgi:hypothetical protein